MRNQLIIGNIFLIIILLSVPTINADKTNSNLIRELSPIDSFHPDNNLTYKEWHYFNIIDEDPDLKFLVIFIIGGNVSNASESYSKVLMAYDINNTPGMSVNSYSILDTNYSNETPDVEINNSYVKLLPNGYEVYDESTDGEIVFSATFIPKASPSTVFSGTFGDRGIMNWVTAAPVCKVNGNLRIDGTVYSLDGVRGYHDHNWGRWMWCDNIGWDWGQAIEPNDEDEADTDVGRYGMTIGRLTNGSHTMDGTSRLQIWKNKKQIATFDNLTFDYNFSYEIEMPYPMIINATAKSGGDNITSIFETSKGLPIYIAYLFGEGCNSTVWELTGNYNVSGTINGKPFNFQAEGFAEYAEYIY